MYKLLKYHDRAIPGSTQIPNLFEFEYTILHLILYPANCFRQNSFSFQLKELSNKIEMSSIP